MKKIFVGIMVTCFVIFLLVACDNGGEEAAIVGTWESVEHYIGGERVKDLEGMSINFFEDGTARTQMGSGTFTVEDELVFFTRDGNEDPDITYNIVGDQLVVESGIVEIFYEKVD